jgi:aerobic-type carbon monoxide dehydrogenase small subunit (CoxS/CutS family)
VRRLRGACERRSGEGLHHVRAEAEGAEVTTIEGMANADGSLA